ncbi:MAG: WhiB family transcriptional regulator [Candidatus Ancillula sp.]|nr:WhiB family transcriptional regulator [Candidatus Ancillula sp.]
MKFERSLANRPLCHYRFTPELWLETSRRTNLATIIASEICKSCGIKNECLAISSKTNASFGVWGGINFASKTTQNKEVLNA